MKILILFGHPAFHKSSINRGLVEDIELIDNVTFHDLYEAYPELDIDIDQEQSLLIAHDCVVFMCPMYWYSTPAIFKEWQDLVLEHGWAYGSTGKALEGKWFFCAMTTGASRKMFNPNAMQRHTVVDFLVPLTQMARLCYMFPLPPFVTHGGHVMEKDQLHQHSKQFHAMLQLLADDEVDMEELQTYEYMNDYLKQKA